MKRCRYPFLCVLCLSAMVILVNQAGTAAAGILLACCSAALLAVCRYGNREWVFLLTCVLSIALAATVRCGAEYCSVEKRLIRSEIRDEIRTLYGKVCPPVTMHASARGPKVTFHFSALGYEDFQGRFFRICDRVRVKVFFDADVFPGDLIALRGRLHPPSDFNSAGRFSYRQYLARQGIHWLLSVGKEGKMTVIAPATRRGFPAWRAHFQKKFSLYLRPVSAGIMRAVILGDRAHIPRYIYDVFRRTGTAHVLAISGLHIGIVTALIFLLAAAAAPGIKRRALLAVVLLWLFVGLTAGRASVLRSAIMATLFLLAFRLERPAHGMNILPAAGCILLVLDPDHLMSIGFQLSFSAVAAILVFFPVWQKWGSERGVIQNRPWVAAFWSSLGVSLAAWFGVAGWVAYYFGMLAPVAVVANLFIVPLMGLIVTLGVILMIIPSGWPVLLEVIAVNAEVIIRIVIALAGFFDRLPGAAVRVGYVPRAAVVGYYAVLVVLGCVCHKVTKNGKRET